jgi:hypothetical protein
MLHIKKKKEWRFEQKLLAKKKRRERHKPVKEHS